MFCPFVKGDCQNDCVFYGTATASGNTVSHCLIVKKLSAVNEMQLDQLSQIADAVSNIKASDK